MACEPDLLSVVTEDFSFERGHPLPFGATVERGGINFAIFSRHATAVTLVLFLPGSAEEIAAVHDDVERQLGEAIEFARKSPFPSPETMEATLWAD